MNTFAQFNQYTENLLLAQYDVSEIIEHQLIKGEVREDFLIHSLQYRFDNGLKIYKGFISSGEEQSGQIDIMLCKTNCQIYRLGTQVMIPPEDCKMLLEVKSNASGTDIREFNEKVARIKSFQASSYPLSGIFCYRIDLTKKNLLRRFGYNYDRHTEAFVNDPTIELVYPHIDFLVSLDRNNEENRLFLRKDTSTNRYVLTYEYPTIKNLFSLVQSLVLVS